ncbi:MAG: hypothetical protein HY046_12960 [Acidobacteria bacterium]|nr:hypothetical protein [Acidobacteriota bacterium]
MGTGTVHGERRYLTEGMLSEFFGIERLEVFLLAAQLKVGQYDSVTHLLMFTPSESDRIAAEFGLSRGPR